MRTLIEVLIVAALVGLTWQQSLQERLASLTGAKLNAAATPAPIVRYVTRPAPAATPASGDWMWDSSRRTTLDRPAYDTHYAQQHYVDPQGRSYWYDAKGIRHYDQ
jgi:hypothetical protein